MEGHQYLQNTTSDPFIVEDLLDFPNDDATFDDSIPANSLSTESSSHTGNALDTSISSASCDPIFLPDRNFSTDLCVPYDEMAELEWLSNVVEESFSNEDLQKLELISGMKARNNMELASHHHNHEFQAETNRNLNNINNNNNNSPIFNSEVSVPAKARSKRSRGSPCNWTSRLLLLSPSPSPSPTSSSSDPILPPPNKKPAKSGPRRKDSSACANAGEGRKCLHCATDKTPQWRTGPMGPKTLCNACGVRYKSGRLVPEYRPAASPTFVLTKHSNSHRKVMELRRQKEMMSQQQQFVQHPNTMFGAGDEYLIHQHVGPDFRHLF
ncbi:GATA transcription factor 12-like [Senna tora]|uniref:GATA transcription factor n=1 Tax=Senna tora TaxID=362788 RepID=A0A834TA54_9FABA|nr:GATA transcription factor 12-like [Senna tora]